MMNPLRDEWQRSFTRGNEIASGYRTGLIADV
jgi:hypothetical protein